jgi:hypothetical protein
VYADCPVTYNIIRVFGWGSVAYTGGSATVSDAFHVVACGGVGTSVAGKKRGGLLGTNKTKLKNFFVLVWGGYW